MPKRKASARRKRSKSRGPPRRAPKTRKAAERAESERKQPPPRRSPTRKPVSLAVAVDWSVLVDWAPTGARVIINFIGANGHEVAQDDDRNHSPASFPLPAPDGNGQYTFTWSMSPDMHVDAMALWAVNNATETRTLVDQSGPKDPGDVWSNYTGKTINAP